MSTSADPLLAHSPLSARDAPSAASPWPARLTALAVGLAVVALLGLFVWGLGRRGTTGAVPVAVRPAPPISIGLFGQPGSPGGSWTLADQRRPVVVNFWASWCLPCEEEAPVLERLSRRYRDRVSFLGVDIQDSDAAAREFLSRFSVSYPNGPDPSGEISIAYGMSGVPETYFVTASGQIVRKWAGPLDEARLVDFVEQLLR
jgi:cytochrome c biogenesis protein CcmG/thiol:disulfide interchange protein DsbE